VQLAGIAFGVPAVVVGILASRWLLAAGALAVSAAVLGHGVWILGMVRTARRPRLDWGLRLVLAGALFLAPTVVLGLGLALEVVSGPRWGLAYTVVALGGWVSLTIAGMMLKIVPFLVWYRAYSPRVGRVPVPTLAQLSWPGAEVLAFVLLTTGMAGLALAAIVGEVWAIRAAGALVAGGALAFAAVLARVIGHLRSVPTPLADGDGGTEGSPTRRTRTATR
jgi:hypothetical protein